MAIIKIQNATVDRVFFDGKGVKVYESFKSQGQDRKAFFTAWFEQAPGLTEGEVVNLSGLFSVKSREYEKDGQTRTSLDVSLNKARVETGSTPEPVQAPQEPSWPVQEPWSGPVVDSTPTPF